MIVTLIASTKVHAAAYDILPRAKAGRLPAPEGEYLVEFAGRACYQSWSRPNARTEATGDYIRSAAIEKGHGSILEHSSATFYITGVSRSLTHELIRHRHLSPSELSQRYVDMSNAERVVPPGLRRSEDAVLDLDEAMDDARANYGILLNDAEEVDLTGKRARQAARSVMPNCTETKIVLTGNYRAWREMIKLRATEHADDEIRELAIELLVQLQGLAPDVFDDLAIVELADGRQVVVV